MKQVAFFIALIVLFSCKKAEDRDCFKVAGKETSTLEVALPAFEKLFVGPKIEVVLVPDTENKLVITGRENLVKHITYSIDDEGMLKLDNKNKCNFLRANDKNKIQVEVHFIALNELSFEGTFNLTTKGFITADHFSLSIRDGGATVYLNVNCNTLEAVQGHGWGDYVLSGSANEATLKIMSNGFADATNFTTLDKLVVISNTPVSSSINVEGASTTVEISGSGNIKYVGNPLSMNFIQYGTGQLINGN